MPTPCSPTPGARYREARTTYTETLVGALDIAAEDPQIAAILTAARESL